MADRSHLEYCVKLGNTIIQNKLESTFGRSYDELYNTYNGTSNNVVPPNYKTPERNEDILNFRQRLQAWKNNP